MFLPANITAGSVFVYGGADIVRVQSKVVDVWLWIIEP
jgi:hypothetical protein